HAKFNWGNASHQSSTKLYGADTIRAQGCMICHRVHAAPIPSYLLAGAEEGVCNTCHDGSPAAKNIAGEFALPYKHPTNTVSGKHNPAETFTTLNDPLFRHAECADCHNPHGTQAGTHTQGSSKIGAVLVGAWGMKPIYSATPWTEPVSWEKVTFTDTTGPDMLEAYLCFKCHKDLAKAFNPNNPSYHAVVGDSKADATVTGSYLNGWTPTSRMTCTDCHRSSSGVKGPHGSSFAQNAHPEPTQNYAIVNNPIIALADYIRGGGHGPSMASPHWTNRGTGGTYDGYGNPRSSDNDLCFQCHNRLVYGHPTDNTYFYVAPNMTGYRGPYYPDQNLHIRHMRGKACTTCHVVHGSDKPHLLAFGPDDFDLNSRLYFTGPAPAGGGWSYVTCHGGSYTGC
ncbi:MAG: cytochrome c3 family protein, partial [Betaproteobacteria bacterium]